MSYHCLGLCQYCTFIQQDFQNLPVGQTGSEEMNCAEAFSSIIAALGHFGSSKAVGSGRGPTGRLSSTGTLDFTQRLTTCQCA